MIKDIPREHTPMMPEADASTIPEPYLSMSLPANGDMNIAHTPPKLIAPENNPRDHPKSSVIGTTKTDNVATAISGLDEKATVTAEAKITQP